MSSDELPSCTWQLIEEILSDEEDKRTDSELLEILPWFREKSSLFYSLEEEALLEVVRRSKIVRVKIDHVVVHQGEKGDCFYIILRGSVTVYAKKMDRSEAVLNDVAMAKSAKERARFGQELSILKAGRCFGELSVMSKDAERNASVITDECSVLICIHRDVYKKYLSDKCAEEIVRRSSFVSTHPLFRGWPSTYRNLLAENIQMRHLKFEEVLVKQGDPIKSVFFVLEGQVHITGNPVMHERSHPQILAKLNRQACDDTNQTSEFDPTKPLTVIDKRRLRNEQGFFAVENRFREISICTIGKLGIIGDIEAIMDVAMHTGTAKCIQEMTAYEIDLPSFTKLILRKNPETFERMKKMVQRKLLHREESLHGTIPIYTAMLLSFEKPKPKDERKSIIKRYLKKQKRQKAVTQDFFIDMCKGISKNQNKPQKDTNKFTRTPIKEIPMSLLNPQTEGDALQKSTKGLWQKTGKLVEKVNLARKGNDGNGGQLYSSNIKTGEIITFFDKAELWKCMKNGMACNKQGDAPKQFTAEEYKLLKKRMQAMGKSAANTKGLKS